MSFCDLIDKRKCKLKSCLHDKNNKSLTICDISSVF